MENNLSQAAKWILKAVKESGEPVFSVDGLLAGHETDEQIDDLDNAVEELLEAGLIKFHEFNPFSSPYYELK